jgi:hypothetical protein
MKLRLLMVMASAVLFLAPRPVSAFESDGQQGAAASGHALMQQNANESAQDMTDMPLGDNGEGQRIQNVSYGGVATDQTESGSRHNRPCGDAPQCKIYFGQ